MRHHDYEHFRQPVAIRPKRGPQQLFARRLHTEQLCHNAGVLFAPSTQEVYPTQCEIFVEPGEFANALCGAARPGQLRGVATFVCKLFNIVRPDVAYFGEKDLQRCAVVRPMVADLNLFIAKVALQL